MKIVAAAGLALGLGIGLGIGLGMIGLPAAQAAPLAPVMPAIAQGASSGEIILVVQGCGPGFHRGPAGACRPLFNCPPGWHTGPYGKRCFRNW